MNWMHFDEPLSRRCTLRIGGPVRVWAEPKTREELLETLRWAKQNALSVEMLGLGSNTLFDDADMDAVLIRLQGEFTNTFIRDRDGDSAIMSVGAGAINAHLVRKSLREGWVGAEFLSLIPGTFGGAVVMNAGTREKELKSILHDIELLEWHEGTKEWKARTIDAAQLEISYRHTRLPAGAIVLGGCIRVEKGDVDSARARIAFDKERRNETQPYRLASIGSTFANPKGDFAGRLIEEVGLKGHRIGGARVSLLHANFFINEEDASAHDFLSLMALARCRVREKFGIELRPEVRFVGFDGWARMLELEEQMMSGQYDGNQGAGGTDA